METFQHPVVTDICSMFQTLKETKNLRVLLSTLSKMFCVLCQEKMQRKLLYTCKIENEEDINIEHFFKNENIIIEAQKEKPLDVYEIWINDCYEKYIHLLLQLLQNDNDILVKKSLAVLFACLQYETKIFEKMQTLENEDSEIEEIKEKGKIQFFPMKLYMKIVISLLKVKTFNISIIKHICKNYICYYYDLNYFFLFLFKIICMEQEKIKRLNNKKTEVWERIVSGEKTKHLIPNEENVTNESAREKGMNDIFNKECDMNIFLYSVLINSVKPKEKEDTSQMKKMKFMKQSRIDFFFSLDDEEKLKRKRKFNEINKKLKNKERGVTEKKDTFNYNSDDSIIHLSSDSDGDNESETFLDKVEITEKKDKDNDDYSSDSNLSEEFRNLYDKIIDEEMNKMNQMKTDKKDILYTKDRTENLFLNIPLKSKVYSNLYSRSWFYFITLFNHNHRMILQMLHSIPNFVFPYTNNRYYLIDFFNYSFYSSSNLYVSLAALPGIFYILTKMNIGDIVDREEGEEEQDASDNEHVVGENETDNSESEKEEEEEEEEEEEVSGKKKKDDSEDEEGEEKNEDEENENEEEEEKQNIDTKKVKMNKRMYTDYYKRLYELITPASFYYSDTNFLKIIFTSLKNKMIPLQYVTAFLKKLLRVSCLTANNISINILCVVYDVLNFFKSELRDAMFISLSLFMNLEIRKDFFSYDNLNENFDKRKLREMLEKDLKEEKIKKEQEKIIMDVTLNENKFDKSTEVKNENDDDITMFSKPSEPVNKTDSFFSKTKEENSINKKKLFSLQECLPEKYKMNVTDVDDEKLQSLNQIFFEIILLNNHLCSNLRQYSNVYYFGFKNKSANMLEFYVDPSKINWKPENAFFFYLKGFLSLKKKTDQDVLPSSMGENCFRTLFI